MAMLIVSDSEFEAELAQLTNQQAKPAAPVQESHSNDNSKAKILDIKSGRGNTKEVPSTVRNVIASESISGTPAKIIQENFPISQSSISAYKQSSTSLATLDHKDSELESHNAALRDKISRGARNKLILALKHITEDKLSSAKVRDAASVAKDMSAIVKNMSDQSNVSETNVQFIIHRPRMKELNEFEVIDVTD